MSGKLKLPADFRAREGHGGTSPPGESAQASLYNAMKGAGGPWTRPSRKRSRIG